MSDISMCPDYSCPHRTRCKRHPESGTKAGKWQSWTMFQKHGDKANPMNCDGWWAIDNKPTSKRKS